MFTDATFDSLPTERHRRGWATLTSFGLQAILVTCMMMLPLYYTQVMPLVSPTTTPLMVPIGQAPPRPQPSEHVPAGNVGTGTPYHGPTWVVPREIPRGIPREEPTGPQIPFERFASTSTYDPAVVGVPGSIGIGPGVVIPPKPPVPKPIRISRMSEGSLIRRIEPVYPQLAKIARIEGPVEIAAIIGRDGTIQSLQVLSGHPYLAQAARDAVAQWRYKPYILNDEAVEVETRITVNFILAH